MRFSALSLAVLLLLTACGRRDHASDTPEQRARRLGRVDSSLRRDRDPKTLHRSLSEPEYLDPGLCSESEGGLVIKDAFEGLYRYGPTHESWPPGVAISHEISPDGRTWTFTLRRDARWSDGAPVTARDFEWSWKRVLDPKSGSRYAAILWVIEGARAYNQGECPQCVADPSAACEARCSAALRRAVGVRAVDDYTLRVRLVGPTPYFQQLTAFYTFMPVPRQAVEAFGDRWARPENMVTNGPWRVTEWRSGQRIVARRNPYYHSPQEVSFDTVIYHITQENDPAHTMYLAGELDLLEGKVPATSLPRYRKERFPDLKVRPYLGAYYYIFNTGSPPFDDPRVRHALNLAIDKEKIGRYVIKGGQPPATTLVPPGLESVGYEAPKGAGFDPDAARTLLAEAGYPGGVGFPHFQISYNTLESHKAIAEFVQQQWKKNLGVRCDLNNMEWKVLLKKQQALDFQVSRYAWIGDYLDPMTFLDMWESDNPNNRTQWDSPEFDRLIASARREPDARRRMEQLAAAERVFLDELPAIPLYFYVRQDLVRPWLKGYEWHLQGVHPSRYLRVEL